MSIDFSKVTAITTPSGSLSKINRTSDSVQLWPYVKPVERKYKLIGLLSDVAGASNHWTIYKNTNEDIVKENTYIGQYLKDNNLIDEYPYAVLLTICAGFSLGGVVTDDTMIPRPKITDTTSSYQFNVEYSNVANNEVISSTTGICGWHNQAVLGTAYYFLYAGGLTADDDKADYPIKSTHCVNTATLNSIGLAMHLPDASYTSKEWSQLVSTYQAGWLPYIGCHNEHTDTYTKAAIPMIVMLMNKDMYDWLFQSSIEAREFRNATINTALQNYFTKGTKPTVGDYVEIE